MGKFGLTTMLLVILTTGTVLAAISREQLDHAMDDLTDAWWELTGERPPALPS